MNPDLGVFLRQLVLFLSAAAGGLALVMSWGRLVLFSRDHFVKDLGFFILFIHIAGLVVLIGYLIFGAPRLIPGWKTYSYAEILLGIGVGLATVAIASRPPRRDHEHV